MNATSKVRKQGGAAIMTIPAGVLKELGIEVGAELSLAVADGELVARPLKAPRKRYSLKELLEGANAMSELNAATDWAREGESVGRELP